ncbi:hypothetical protein RMSM_06384 [Rhodopirellula maiorica SM1]|uniref:Novel STAND NTPase 1 domain-containing protein n=1 Tax=Rhodopirellula maiorica SM1 TaxID=1265738 RepID=M5RMS2_9BACT|nr:AAA family ATPase [Rhodopirellula maiorica]EMI16687.1 hypothetical protein RMSM_06384 [Rhodopirellula maiorica SM1]
MDFHASNPFCTRIVRPGAIEYQFESLVAQQVDAEHVFDDLVQRISDAPLHLITGPHGSGKSTLIRALVPRLMHRFTKVVEVQLHQPPSQSVSLDHVSCRRWFAAATERSIHQRKMAQCVAEKQREARTESQHRGLLIIDGLEQLSWWSVAYVRRRAKRWGQTVLATSHRSHRGFATLRDTTLDSNTILELTEWLIASLAESEQTQVRRELLRRALGPQTNLRDLWFDLYDLIETSRRQQYARSLERRDRSIAPSP